MTIAYWIAAGPLACFYFYAGALKLVRSRDRLRPMMGWVDRIPLPAVRALGTIEVLGAIGLLLPPAIGTAPWVALAAAVGFVILQIGAITVHLTDGDGQVTLNVVLVVTAAATVWPATSRL